MVKLQVSTWKGRKMQSFFFPISFSFYWSEWMIFFFFINARQRQRSCIRPDVFLQTMKFQRAVPRKPSDTLAENATASSLLLSNFYRSHLSANRQIQAVRPSDFSIQMKRRAWPAPLQRLPIFNAHNELEIRHSEKTPQSHADTSDPPVPSIPMDLTASSRQEQVK